MKYATYALLVSLATATPNPKLMLVDNLDEPNNYGFCMDMTSRRGGADFTTLQLQSCKPDTTNRGQVSQATDQQFYPESDQVKGYGDATGRCLQAKTPSTVGEFDAGTCSTTCGLQSFCFNSDGTISLNDGNTNKCVVAGTTIDSMGT